MTPENDSEDMCEEAESLFILMFRCGGKGKLHKYIYFFFLERLDAAFLGAGHYKILKLL